MRKAVRAILYPHSFLDVCGEAWDGKEAVQQVERLKPDIVILDINMPVMDGIYAAQEIRRISPETKIVFLTLFDTPPIMEAARLWADAFVSKALAGRELIPALKRFVREETPQPQNPVKSRQAGTT